MIVLGIDQSTHTGWSLQGSPNPWSTPHHETGELSYKLVGMQRVKAFSDWFIKLVEKAQPDLVVFEAYAIHHISSVVTVVEIGTAFRLACHILGFPYVEIPPTSLKQFVTGKGTSKKDEVMLHVYKKWGFEAKTNNEADAFALARAGLVAGGMCPTNPEEVKILRKVQCLKSYLTQQGL